MYVDGVLTPGRSVRYSDFIRVEDVREDFQLLAVKCYNVKRFGAILVSVGDVLISGSNWKCSKNNIQIAGEEWYKKDFNDSSWSDAHVLGNNDDSYQRKEKVTQIKNYAQWIWFDGTNEDDEETVYCRGRPGKST